MGFLEEIVRESRKSVEDPEYGAILSDRSPGHPRSFRKAVEEDRSVGALVVEYKRVSPGQAEARLPVHSVDQFLERTRAARPSAFSCLATIPRFEGSPADVGALVRSTDRPVLFKDFVVDPRQISVAARAGASAVLLIARLETEGHLDTPLADLAHFAHDRGLEVVLEFHGRSELSRVTDVAADVYGVNTRNLDTLAIDRPNALETMHEARQLGLRPLLGLSGVEDTTDAQRFWAAGADGILVGSAVARADDASGFLATLRRPLGGGAA